MKTLESIAFVVAAVCFVLWLALIFGIEPTGFSGSVYSDFLLGGATICFLIGFASLTVQYAKAVAPEWNDNDA